MKVSVNLTEISRSLPLCAQMNANAIARKTVRFPHLSCVAQLLPCCSVCAVLLSLCRVAHLCRVAQFVQYLCTGDIEQRTVTQSWQYLFAFSYHVSN